MFKNWFGRRGQAESRESQTPGKGGPLTAAEQREGQAAPEPAAGQVDAPPESPGGAASDLRPTERPPAETGPGDAPPGGVPPGDAQPAGAPVPGEAPSPSRPDGARAVAEPATPQAKTGWFERLRAGLSKTRDNLLGRIDAITRGRGAVDEAMLEALEEALLEADVGVSTTMELMKALRARLAAERAGADRVKPILAELVAETLSGLTGALAPIGGAPTVYMVVGVNGSGKTTTIGKLAYRFRQEGRHVIVGAGDTFRAAAIEQLEVWAQRAGVEIVKHQQGADPAAVAYDAVHAARSRKADLLIVDTAGRLQTKTNLMNELAKVRRVITRELGRPPDETLLVIDATTGQNGLSQARHFKEAVEVSGIVLTKLDGTAKGGIVIAIAKELGIPVKLIGVGETAQDLREFDPKGFAAALFGDA